MVAHYILWVSYKKLVLSAFRELLCYHQIFFCEVCVAHPVSFLCLCFLYCTPSFCVLCPMLAVSLDFPWLIAPSVLSNVYFHWTNLRDIADVGVKQQSLTHSLDKLISMRCLTRKALLTELWHFLWYIVPIRTSSERTWRRLFQIHVVHTKFDIYVFINHDVLGFLCLTPFSTIFQLYHGDQF